MLLKRMSHLYHKPEDRAAYKIIAILNRDNSDWESIGDRIALAFNCHDDLLEACRACVQILNDQLQGRKTFTVRDAITAKDAARAAIAKAEGKG